MTADFVGIKIGDLTLDATAAAFTGDENEDRSDETLLFAIDDEEVVAGNEYRISFKAKDLIDLSAYQYTLGFNQSRLQLKEVEMGSLPKLTEQHFNFDRIDEGLIASIWYNEDATTLEDDEVLFTLVFDAITSGGNLSDQLRIVSDPVVSAAYNSNLEKMEVDLTFNSVTSTVDVETNGFQLYQNRPNPFGTETIIPFHLQHATKCNADHF